MYLQGVSLMGIFRSEKKKEEKRNRYGLWTCFVLLVGYATLLYSVIRGIIYLLTLIGGNG